MDISAEIAAIQAASQGSELRQPLVGALNKLNSGSLPAVTASDVDKILKVGANGWEVGEKSGYMPVPTATMQITENGTHDVTDYASAYVNVSGGGGGGGNILSGISMPSNSIGIDGDIYLQYAGIPLEYQPIDYILSTGDQYIDTEVIPNTDTEVEIDFEFVTLNSGSWRNICGAQLANINRSFTIGIYGNSKHTYQRGSSYFDVNNSSAVNTRYIFKTKNNILYKNDIAIATLGNCVVDTPVSLFIFACNRNNTLNAYIDEIYKCYGIKIWQNEKLIRYFVPCLRNLDSVAGLLDVVNQVFYTSESSNDYSYGQTTVFTSNTIISEYCKVNGSWILLDGADINDVNLG